MYISPLLSTHITLPMQVLFDHRLSPVLRDSLFQLMALAGSSPDHTTPDLTLLILEKLTGKAARTWRGHLVELRLYHAIESIRGEQRGWFSVRLSGWLYPGVGADFSTLNHRPFFPPGK